MSSINTLHELLIDELRDIYDAENQLLKALPKMAKAATNAGLKRGLIHHLEETENHVARLKNAFERLSAPAEEKPCKAMQGLLEEGAEAMSPDIPDALRDARLIGAAQRVEHYEIAAYGTARSFAETLGEYEVVDLLERTLEEEKTADETLTAISESVNEDANAVGAEARRN